MTVIRARQLAPHELARLGNNTAAAARRDQELCPGAYIRPDATRSAPSDVDEQIEAAMRSEESAS